MPARRHARADAPPESVRQVEVVRITAEHCAAVAGELDTLIEFLAQNQVEGEVRLPSADALVVILGARQLDHPTNSQRERMLVVVLGQQVYFGAQPKVAELIVRPSLSDERVVVDDSTGLGLPRQEDRADVAIDATDDRPRTEHLRPIGKTERERQRPVADVRETLVVVVVDTVCTPRPLAGREYLTGRHEPEPGISHEG